MDLKSNFNHSSNVFGDSNDEKHFSQKLLLTNTQVSKIHKAVANGSSANIELSKTQLYKIVQSREVLGRLLEPLLKTGLPLIGNVLKPKAKSVLKQSGLTTIASATEAAVRKKMFGSGFTTLIIFNKEMNGFMKWHDNNMQLNIFILINNVENYQKIYNHVWRNHESRI